MSLKAAILTIFEGSRGILFFDGMPIFFFHFSQKERDTLIHFSWICSAHIASPSSLTLDLKVSF